MKILEKEFTFKNFKFKQLKREGDLAVYVKNSIKGKCQSFETVMVRSHNGYEIAGNFIPPSEVYPSTSQWGLYGWTYTNEESAFKKFRELQSRKAE